MYRGLHFIDRPTAKRCLVRFLKSVKAAVDELHKIDSAHLDIRLPNICLRSISDCGSNRFDAVLINLESSKSVITSTLNDEVDSCMYQSKWLHS